MFGTKGRTSEAIIMGSWLITLGCGLLSSIPGGHKMHKVIYGYEVILGLGYGLAISATTIVANYTKKELSG
jgi:hypothetical protein